jgi:DNA-binding NtrC family response regulator
MAHLLIVDDEPAITKSLSAFFERNGGHIVSRAHGGAEGLDLFMRERPDVVLLDLRMPDLSGFEVLQRIREYDPVVIVITAHGDVPVAVEAMRNGAENFLTKPVDLPHLAAATERALEKAKLKQLNALLRAQQKPGATIPRLGTSHAMNELERQIELLALSDRTTGLVLGENGTGKGRVAALIHSISPRALNAFVEVNCAVTYDQKLESELFGHERGSFSGAYETKAGLFEIANEGTVFIDEVADLPLDLQPKLLEVLEGKGFMRMGGTQRLTPNVRVLSATSKDLVAEVNTGKFREDLYYRLSVMPIHLPPVRARSREDLISLIGSVIMELQSYVTEAPQVVSDEALDYLMSHSWPGNVRELRNVLERALLVARGSDIVKPEHLPIEVRNTWGNGAELQIPKTLIEMERAHIHRTLRAHNLNRTQAARALGISRATLVKKIKQFGLIFRPGS